MQPIRIATWNVSECVRKNWDIESGFDMESEDSVDACVDRILALCREHRPDLLCLQEYPLKIAGSEHVTERICREGGFDHVVGKATYPSFLIENAEAGIVLFSRYPICSWDYVPFWNPNVTKYSKTGKRYYTFDKGLIVAKMQAPFPCCVITGHAVSFVPFDLRAEDYPQSFEALPRAVRAALDEGCRVVVAGDFNTENLFSILPELSSLVKDHPLGPTTVEGKMEGKHYESGRRLDYFLTAGGVTATFLQTVTDFSDHKFCLGVFAAEGDC